MALKILVIEDNQQVRENIVEILDNEGFEMHQAENGIIGIEQSKKVQPDLILCDIMMPDMDGYDVLIHLRKNVLTSTIPFIFLTAKDTREDLRKGMQLGADDYISKPFTIDEILDAVNTRIHRIKEFKKKSEEKLNELTENLGLPIAKEINEPLKAIIGFSGMVITEYNQMEKAELVEFVSLIYNAGMKLNKIVLKTMLYYRLEALSVQQDDMKDLLNQKINNSKKITEGICKEIANSAGRADDLMLMLEECDLRIPEHFYKELLKELLENAFNFSPKNTLVKVISGVEKHKMVISIIDEGIGMSDAQISNIGAFMQFNKDVYNQEGIGLGITIAKRILRLFDGSFSINSKQGMGTIVKIVLNVG